MERQEFIQALREREDIQKDLFVRGFLISDKKTQTGADFPFFGNWTTEEGGGYYFSAHTLTGRHLFVAPNGVVHFIMGHAYDPFAMEYREEEILKGLAEAYGSDAYMERINDLTGVFVLGCVDKGELFYLVDPSGMQSACCGIVDGTFYLTSHAQLVGDLCDLTMSPLVKRLTEYKWYRRVMGAYLPADLTPFEQLKRVVPSIAYHYNGYIAHKRFWPLEESSEVDGAAYERLIEQAGDILRNNMLMISKKWERSWISLTGGIDSNTTFAAANGCYDRFETFSYISAPKEIPDAEAARKVSERFGVKHNVYHIPLDNAEFADYDLIAELLRHNNGYVAERRENETRKRMFLKKNIRCEVEVKSWTSETIRGYWYKHYGRKSMPKLSPKLYRNLYKIFISDRALAHVVDTLFERYLEEYEYYDIPAFYPAADIHFNEVTWGSWGGLNISEMKYICDLTIPYNNRRFLDLMFRVPLSKRISDEHHLDMKRYLNKELYDMHIRVVNMEETPKRAFMLNVIFTINSILPF